MIEVRVKKSDSGDIIGFHMSGHAGYDEHGFDIVCAAVSALTATAMLGLTQIAQQEGEYTNSEGRCDIVLSGTINQSGQDILGTMLLGLEEISRQYPEFVQIHEI